LSHPGKYELAEAAQATVRVQKHNRAITLIHGIKRPWGVIDLHGCLLQAADLKQTSESRSWQIQNG
jgi:hypothetical protein